MHIAHFLIGVYYWICEKLFTLKKSGGNWPVFLGFGTLVLQRTDVTCNDVSELLLKIGNLENNAGFIDCVITSGALAMP